MSLFIDFFHQCKYDSAYLWTTHEQEGAVHLYKKNGFELTEEFPSTNYGKLLKEQRYDFKNKSI